MKKYKNKVFKSLVGASLCLSALTMATSCDQLGDEFYNPDEITDGKLEFFFTDALKQQHLFRLDYGASYHHINNFCREMGLGANVFYSFSSNAMLSAQSYWTSWSGAAFQPTIFEKTGVDYTVNFNGMQLLYNDMTPEDKEIYKIFILCSRIVKGYAFQRSTDLYDDIPYSEASGAFQQNFYPKYDTQEEIYTAILADLEEASKELSAIIAGGGLSSASKTKFNTTDILNNGDLDKWLRMSNSLRLRMGMRLVNVKPDVAKSIVTSLIKENHLVTEKKYDISFKERDQSPTVVAQDLFFRGFEEMGSVLLAPQFILEDILHANESDLNKVDPRLYVIYQPNKDGQYVGLPTQMDDSTYFRRYFTEDKFTKAQFAARLDSIATNKDIKAVDPQPNDASGSTWYTGRLIARYNRATFLNYEMSFPVISSNEVNLLIAEAAVRWPGDVSVNATDKVKEAIEASTRYYYDLNVNNKYSESTSPAANYIPKGAKLDKLDEAHLAGYLANAATEFNKLDEKGKIKFIFHQKYVHNNILYPYESFNEARRIIYDLNEIPVKIMANYYWWERLRYPDSESTDNSNNFDKVKSKNNIAVPVWWTGRTTPAINPNATPGVSLVPSY